MRRVIAWVILLIGCAALADTKQADSLFAQRADPKKLEQAIQAYEDAGAWERAVFCCVARLEIYTDLTRDSMKVPWIERGLKDGAKALGADDPDDVPDRLDGLAKKDALALFCFAACYGRKLEQASVFRQPFMVGTFRKLAERAAALDATAYHGGPWRMLAEFHATAPGTFGGDKEKAKGEAQRAVDVEPRLLLNFCTRSIVERENGDRAAAKADAERVLAGDVHAIPGLEPEQEAAKRDAKALLEKLKD